MLEVIRISLKHLLVPQLVLFWFFLRWEGHWISLFYVLCTKNKKNEHQKKKKTQYKHLKLPQISRLIHPERWYNRVVWICIYCILIFLIRLLIDSLYWLHLPPSLMVGVCQCRCQNGCCWCVWNDTSCLSDYGFCFTVCVRFFSEIFMILYLYT